MRLLLTGILLFHFVFLKGQETAKAIISNYVEQMGKIGMPEKGKTYYLDMSVKNIYNGEKTGPAGFHMDIFLTHSQMRYTSDLISVFQDTVDALVLLPANKQIFWTKATKIANALERSRKLTDFQIEVVNSANIEKISEETINGLKFRIISLIPSSDIAEKFDIERLVFHYCQNQKRIERVKIFYNKTKQLKSQEFIYTIFDLDYKKSGKEFPVKYYIFDSSGNLLEKYKGYELIDNRA